jgi:hypothetical protein
MTRFLNVLKTKSSLKIAACVLAGLATLAAARPARADIIDLTYTFNNGNTVALALGGNLQSDGNTFDVSSVQSFAVNGNAVADPFTVASTDSLYAGVTTGPIVTVNGSYLDLFITDTLTGNVFAFAVGDVTSQYIGNTVGASVALGGDGGEDVFQLSAFDPSVVPEPGSLPLLASMLALTALLVGARTRPTPMRQVVSRA